MGEPAPSKSDLIDKTLALTGAPRGKEGIARANLARKSAEELASLHERLSSIAKRSERSAATERRRAQALALRNDALERLRAALTARAQLRRTVQRASRGDPIIPVMDAVFEAEVATMKALCEELGLRWSEPTWLLCSNWN